MNNDHPMQPPLEWVGKLRNGDGDYVDDIRAAYAAGADAELEACVSFLTAQGWDHVPGDLRAARRPKPPSLKQRAMDAYNRLYHPSNIEDFAVIRVALEALPND